MSVGLSKLKTSPYILLAAAVRGKCLWAHHVTPHPSLLMFMHNEEVTSSSELPGSCTSLCSLRAE